VGHVKVGKTAIHRRFTDNTFSNESGIKVREAKSRILIVTDKEGNEACKVKITIFDLRNKKEFAVIHEELRTMGSDIHGIIIVFDITSRKSFKELVPWFKVIGPRFKNTRKILVGNKIDRVKDQNSRAVSTEEAQEFAEEHGVLYIEVSAKTGEDVVECFTSLSFIALEDRLPVE